MFINKILYFCAALDFRYFKDNLKNVKEKQIKFYKRYVRGRYKKPLFDKVFESFKIYY